VTEAAFSPSFAVWDLPRQESRFRTFRRRAVSIPFFLTANLLMLAISPVLYPILLLSDLLRWSNFAAVRAIAMVQVYLLCETIGTLVSAAVWMRHRGDRQRFLEANFNLECWWASSLYVWGQRLFRFKVEVSGAEHLSHGPMLLFSRHVSPIDNLLPAVLVSAPHNIQLRWVINRSLLRDPCIDIVGNRLPNCFVANSSGDSDAEIRRVEALGRNLGPNDGVLIFPEGGLYTPAKRERILGRIRESGDAELAERAARLKNVLPPRLGGSLALLESAHGVDAVFMAHTGLEGATEYHNILRGRLIGKQVRVRIWRVPWSEIPASPEARRDWLFDQWEQVDSWIAANS